MEFILYLYYKLIIEGNDFVKKIFRFGSFSNETICGFIFITSILIVFRFMYYSRFSISIDDSELKQYIFQGFMFYTKYLWPAVVVIWLKFICEFIYRIMESVHGRNS